MTNKDEGRVTNYDEHYCFRIDEPNLPCFYAFSKIEEEIRKVKTLSNNKIKPLVVMAISTFIF